MEAIVDIWSKNKSDIVDTTTETKHKKVLIN
jgi:hypothetical protein